MVVLGKGALLSASDVAGRLIRVASVPQQCFITPLYDFPLKTLVSSTLFTPRSSPNIHPTVPDLETVLRLYVTSFELSRCYFILDAR